MRESKVEAHLKSCVEAAGGSVWKVQFIGRRGAPDRLIGFPSGWRAFVECKAPGKRPTAQQRKRHDELRFVGFDVFVVDSIESVEKLMYDAGYPV